MQDAEDGNMQRSAYYLIKVCAYVGAGRFAVYHSEHHLCVLVSLPPPTLNLMTFISVRGQTSASYTFLYILHFIPLSLAQSPSAPRCLLSQACA